MSPQEQILVIERCVLEQIGMFQGLIFDVNRYLDRIFTQGIPRFMPRSQAEDDPFYKQLIPYVIMNYQDKYLSYVRGRRAGEARLVGNGSIGIGGHINPADDMPLFNTNFYETYLTAVAREVAEEISVETNHTDRIVALLNDDSNEVGSVHLGVVHYWILDEPEVEKKEQMITQLDFKTIDELQQVRCTLETWSQLCLDGLGQMAEVAKSSV